MKSNTVEKLKQIPDRCLMVGVDPHKRRHVAVVMTQDARVWGKGKFDNDMVGYTKLKEWARERMMVSGSRGVIFAIEAGGHYWRNLAYYLDNDGMPVRLINPFTLKRRREGEDINRRKNDYRDAEMAAELLRTGKFVNARLPYGVWAELRAAHVAYRRMVNEGSRVRNTLRGLLDGIFPEFVDVFKNPCGKTALAVLSLAMPPAAIAVMDPEVFVAAVRGEFSGRGLGIKRLRELQRLARTSAGIREGTASVAGEIASLAQRIHLVMVQTEQQVIRLVELVRSIPESRNLLSVRGISYITVAGLLAELGPLTNYQNSRQLIKMAGTNPTESESAGKSTTHTPMSKKGRAVLRWVLWSAAANLIRLNDDFRSWAKALRDRPAHAHPLHRREVIGAVCNRLLRLVYALVKSGQQYQQPAIS